jgi:hypothetical protein
VLANGAPLRAAIGWDSISHPLGAFLMNSIVYIVGLVVIIAFVLGYFGLR